MTRTRFSPDELRLEGFSPEHHEPVAGLLLKFMERSEEERRYDEELGLVFKSSADRPIIDPIVNHIFEEHPGLEEDRREMDKKWWDNLSEEDKEEYKDDKELFKEREDISRLRVVLSSPFSAELHRAEIQHHLENTDARNGSVVMERNAVLGYLAVWNGASTLYGDDHMQVDVKAVDPELSVEDQRLVVSTFEPILHDLSLP